jgi:hypothetical protein
MFVMYCAAHLTSTVQRCISAGGSQDCGNLLEFYLPHLPALVVSAACWLYLLDESRHATKTVNIFDFTPTSRHHRLPLS